METFEILVVEEDTLFCEVVVTAIAHVDLAPASAPLVKHTESKAHLLQMLSAEPQRFALVVCHWEAVFADDAESFRLMKARFPHVSFVVSSGSNSLNVPQRALKAGAAGFFRRDSPPGLMRNVVALVLGGEAFALPDHLR